MKYPLLSALELFVVHNLSDTFQFDTFDVCERTRATTALRLLGQAGTSMEEAANEVVEYLYRSFQTPVGKPACALIRCFKTHRLGDLPADLREVALRPLGGSPSDEDVLCLTLLGTRGDQPEWNTRFGSRGHKAIPLASPAILARAPMIARLIVQFGLDPHSFLNPEPNPSRTSTPQTLRVFHVEQALDSDFIPAQSSFVVPFGIHSVLGFGGLFPSGDLFCILMFSRIHISPETANLFEPLASEVSRALLGPGPRPIFSGKAPVV